MLKSVTGLGWGVAVAALAGCGSDGVSLQPDAGPDARVGTFPAGFAWGGATAAFQAESAEEPPTDWSVWETMTGKIAHGDRSAAGPDEWTHYEADFALAQSMGHNAYRFSIEWARIEPSPGTFDEAAIAHYRAMLASMKAHGLRPIVTLWHFTNPTWVQDPSGAPSLGGWERPEVADAYVSYVSRVIPRFSDDVDFWITLNEPMIYVIQGYFFAMWPPGHMLDMTGAIAVHNHLIDAHVRAYDAIHAHYQAIGKAVTVTIASNWVAFDPAGPADADATRALERLVDYAFLDAIVAGDVDTGLDGTISHRDDYAHHVDVIGVNFYQRQVVTAGAIGIVPGLPGQDPNAVLKSDLGWELYPAGMGRALDGLWGRFQIPIVITENGVADAADRYRSWYIVSHLDEVQAALARGVDVRGYLHWALIDNFEWAEGLAPRFGLVAIDYAAPERTRTVRPSAGALSDIIHANEVNAEIRTRWGATPSP
jgi:beta-glucosidase